MKKSKLCRGFTVFLVILGVLVVLFGCLLPLFFQREDRVSASASTTDSAYFTFFFKNADYLTGAANVISSASLTYTNPSGVEEVYDEFSISANYEYISSPWITFDKNSLVRLTLEFNTGYSVGNNSSFNGSYPGCSWSRNLNTFIFELGGLAQDIVVFSCAYIVDSSVDVPDLPTDSISPDTPGLNDSTPFFPIKAAYGEAYPFAIDGDTYPIEVEDSDNFLTEDDGYDVMIITVYPLGDTQPSATDLIFKITTQISSSESYSFQWNYKYPDYEDQVGFNTIGYSTVINLRQFAWYPVPGSTETRMVNFLGSTIIACTDSIGGSIAGDYRCSVTFYNSGYDFVYNEGVSAGTEQGYESGYNTGYEEGYNAGANDNSQYNVGYNKGYSVGLAAGQNVSWGNLNVVSLFLSPVNSFLATPLFGSFSIGTAFSVVLVVLLAAIFIKMFAGG